MTQTLQIAAIIGSLRPNSYTLRLINIVLDEIRQQGPVQVDLIHPAGLPLALPGQPNADELQLELVRRVNAADGLILGTPEYHGSYSSVMKALIDSMGYPSALAGKPVALVGAASGAIGAVKALEHLRSVCSHAGALVLPYPVSVAQIELVIDEEGNCLVPAVEEQLRKLGVQLLEYVRGRRRNAPLDPSPPS